MLPAALLLAALAACAHAQYNYSANWPSINSRPLPSWYDQAKVRAGAARNKPRNHMPPAPLHDTPHGLHRSLAFSSTGASSPSRSALTCPRCGRG